jgi:hypothetical protein
MPPPTDPQQHCHALGITEVASSGHGAQAPPPAYSANSHSAYSADALSEPKLGDSNGEGHVCNYDEDDEYNDDSDDEWNHDLDSPSSSYHQAGAITININASLRIEGNCNTILLARGPAATATTRTAATSTINSAPIKPAKMQTGPESSDTFTRTILASIRNTGLATDPHTRSAVATMGPIATRKTGPINLDVDKNVAIRGNGNTVYLGVGRRQEKGVHSRRKRKRASGGETTMLESKAGRREDRT